MQKSEKLRMIIFDLDGTLTESKSDITDTMVATISRLQTEMMVAVISGCSGVQFRDQFLSGFTKWDATHNLWLLPTCGAEMYTHYSNPESSGEKERDSLGWICEYDNKLLLKEKVEIFNAFQAAIDKYNIDLSNKSLPAHWCFLKDLGETGNYGEVAEDRGSQVTFSMLGQQAPLKIKLEWDPIMEKRKYLAHLMKQRLVDFEIRIGGTTSIDITKKGIDKSYGILNLMNLYDVDIDQAVFIGDALYEGGNDHAVKSVGIKCIDTSGPSETLRIISRVREGEFNAIV